MTMQSLHEGRNAPDRSPKNMARVLREKMQTRDIVLTHSECLEIVAAQLGARDWNTLAANANKESEPLRKLAIPDGWFAGGIQHETYEIGIDPDTKWQNQPCVKLQKALHPDELQTATVAAMTQVFSALKYRGQRVQFTARLKAKDVTESGSIWMRAQDKDHVIVAFDNMENRESNGAIRGSSDWVQRHIVLDIPDSAVSITIGFYLHGSGILWCAGAAISEVDPEVDVTAIVKLKSAPENLAFITEKAARRRGFGYGPRAAPIRTEQPGQSRTK